MPREQRKRGKKHKKPVQEEPQFKVKEEVKVYDEPKPAGEPSWIVSAVKPEDEEINPEAPFGYVDADVKAYFRTVDTQIRAWQGDRVESVPAEDENDPNEEKRLFFVAALNEMRDKEKQMATDPDCSVILERMAYSMDDFVRRVFIDSLAGSYEALFRHHFASHVCQTLLFVARDSIARETKGITPSIADSSDQGELRSMTQLVLDICEEILPNSPSLFMDPFASHVIRSLLLLLSPNLSSEEENSESHLRSKKSAAWKAKQGQMKSLFANEKGKGKDFNLTRSPLAFQRMARRFVEELRTHLDENEIRAMAANKVACPGLQLLLQVESDQNMTNQPDSLMDRVTVGIISACHDDTTSEVVESDYLGTLLRDPTSSHLLEIVASCCPDDAFYVLWNTYFKGKLPRLAIHPVANFVLAKAMERVPEGQLLDACKELESIWNKLIKTSRTGVLRTAVERATTFSLGETIPDTIYHAFDIKSEEEKGLIVPCVLVLLPVQEYRNLPASSGNMTTTKANTHHRKRQEKPESNKVEPTIQGSLLLQSLLRLPEPHNQFIVDSLLSLPTDQRIKIAHHSSGSRIYDVLLDSKTVPAKAKRQLILDFLGSYHLLVDDRIGSRVGDRCWEFCDTYLKEKIARSLIPEEQALAASYYGKFFARNLNLYLLQRRPQDWRNLQSERKRSQGEKNPPHPPVEIRPPQTELPTRKRKSRPDDEIDALFDAKLGNRVKKATLADDVTRERPHPSIVVPKTNDKQLDQIFNAIEAAPKSDGYKRKKKKI